MYSQTSIILTCIDTSELPCKRAEPFPTRAARHYLREVVVGRKVAIRRITSDRYGRIVAEIFVDRSNVQQQLVASGHASIYWLYANQCPWIQHTTHNLFMAQQNRQDGNDLVQLLSNPLKTTQIYWYH